MRVSRQTDRRTGRQSARSGERKSEGVGEVQRGGEGRAGRGQHASRSPRQKRTSSKKLCVNNKKSEWQAGTRWRCGGRRLMTTGADELASPRRADQGLTLREGWCEDTLAGTTTPYLNNTLLVLSISLLLLTLHPLLFLNFPNSINNGTNNFTSLIIYCSSIHNGCVTIVQLLTIFHVP